MRKRTGTTFQRGGVWHCRLTINGKRSPPIKLENAKTKEAAQLEALELTKLANDEAVSEEIDRSKETASQWFSRFFDHRATRGYSDVAGERGRFKKWVEPQLGSFRMRAINRIHIKSFVAFLDEQVREEELSWKSALNLWAIVRRGFRESCSSKLDALEVRSTDPTKDIQGPDKGADKSKTCLYPSELKRFLECERVPIVWRRGVALSVYSYVRASELRGLNWENVDLEVRRITVNQTVDEEGTEGTTKSEHTRTLPIESALMPLLEAMHDEANGEGALIDLPDDRHLSRALRAWLRVAGVNRKTIHESTKTHMALRWHDLRATGITWRVARNDNPMAIKAHCGHEDLETTQRYVREAEVFGDNFGVPFPELPSGVLSQSIVPNDEPLDVRQRNHKRFKGWRRRESNPGPQGFKCIFVHVRSRRIPCDWVHGFGRDLFLAKSTALLRTSSRDPALVVNTLGIPGRSLLWMASRFLRPRERVHYRSHVYVPLGGRSRSRQHADALSVPTSKPIAPVRCFVRSAK